MLHFQKLDDYQRSIDFLPLARRIRERLPKARGSAMESAAHLDLMRVDELIDTELYARGIELLERVVALLTKLIDP